MTRVSIVLTLAIPVAYVLTTSRLLDAPQALHIAGFIRQSRHGSTVVERLLYLKSNLPNPLLRGRRICCQELSLFKADAMGYRFPE